MRNENTNKKKYFFKEGMIIIAIILPFLFWLSRYINIDFWHDEVYTLKIFVFRSLKSTVTWYFLPNNHIFFNLINNIYLKLIGIKGIHSLMDHPYKIRLLPLVYTLLTLLYLYLIGRKFFNKFIANLSLIILVTTIPYYNFALQVRGYSLSMLLLCMMLYHLWSFEKSLRWSDGFLLVFSAALSLYTIPLNLYFILGIGIIYFSVGTFRRIKKRNKRQEVKSQKFKGKKFNLWHNFYSENRYFIIVFLTGISIILAILLYLPVIDKVVYSGWVKSHGLFHIPTLFRTMPLVFIQFVSGRHLFIPVIILGSFIYTIFYKEKDLQLVHKALFCITLLLMPFILSFIRGDRPFLRVFVNLTPIFALLVSISVYFLQSTIPILRSKILLATLIMFLYCNITFAISINYIIKHLRSDIETGHKSRNNLYYNYYQAHYHPLKLLNDFIQNYEMGSIPVIAYDSDRVALPEYLKKFRIKYDAARISPRDTNQIIKRRLKSHLRSTLLQKKQVYVITPSPNNFETMIMQEFPRFQCKKINEQLSFHNIFLLFPNKAYDEDEDGISDGWDNCPDVSNPNQDDYDKDGTGDVCDSCTDTDKDGYGNPGFPNTCGEDNCPDKYNPGQEDTYPPGGNGIGNACECEGDFDCDGDVDESDAALFKADFGRNQYKKPCTNNNPCNGDFDCDGDVDWTDAEKFKEDYGKRSRKDQCPPCVERPYCLYQ